MRGNSSWQSFACLLLLVFAFFLLAGCGGQPQATPSKDQTAQAVREQPASQASSQTGSPEQSAKAGIRVVEALVTSVSDGDTVHVKLDGRDERVRMIGVNCPEVSHPDLGIKEQPYGRKAKEYTTKQLLGKKVWLEFDIQQRDKYGRLLAYVWLELPASGSEDEVRAKMFNARLLLDGYAQVMTVPPNVKYSDLFVKFQREAREQGKGLWGLAPAAPSTGKGGETGYIGNARSKVFHRPDCEWAQKIAPHNRVEFGSREEALEAGYRPCKVCNP
ncbi:thermonuclease family protein [Ammonifex thiophilus]|uniref:thermonuclease family protein n=1 Tax=Ammonifex thiophilus TaxID=444093 RepID=UPI001F0B7413|nr:thermonuclease family protein [Ammonifex thiophilus]